MILVENLTKEFKKPIRQSGVWGMFKTLFSHKYETKVAVDHINFSINKGDIVGYIGSNGAGKSTTIKMMCGILNPSSGKVLIDGKEPYKNRKEVCKHIGVVFGQKTQLWWDIPLIESFKVLKEVYLVSDKDYEERMKMLTDLLDLAPFMKSPVRTLSLGQRMRADLACAMIHNPDILFLDEPTIGLDVLVKDKIRKAIIEMNKKYNTTIILTTHDMADIEKLCNRIIIIDEGKAIYDGTQENLKSTFGDLRTIVASIEKEKVDIKLLNDFDKKVTYISANHELIAKFEANNIDVEDVIGEMLKHIHCKDIKIKSIDIEYIAKKVYKNGEVKHEKKQNK